MSKTLDSVPKPNMKDLEISKPANEKVAGSITAGSVTPVQDEDTAAGVKDSFLGSTQQHAFTLPADLSYWSNVYEEARYEGRHRFDPLFQWSSIEEKKLVRKVVPPSFLACLLLTTSHHLSRGTSSEYAICWQGTLAAWLPYYAMGMGHVLFNGLDPPQHQSCCFGQLGMSRLRRMLSNLLMNF
jgi:hypothetical protein